MWDLLKKSIQFVFSIYAFLMFFLTGFITLIYYAIILPLPTRTRLKWVYAYNYYWMTTWGLLCGITFEVRGREHVNKEETYIFCSNHVNILDIFTTASHIRHTFMPLAKKEVYQVPILGQLVAINSVPVDRSSPESRAQSIKNMLAKIEERISILIFPEGTRNRTGKPLKKFYDGGFRLAITSQKTLIPIVLLNSRDLQPVHTYLMKPGKIRMDFLTPIPTTGMTLDDVESLREEVKNIMETHLLKEDKFFKDYSTIDTE